MWPLINDFALLGFESLDLEPTDLELVSNFTHFFSKSLFEAALRKCLVECAKKGDTFFIIITSSIIVIATMIARMISLVSSFKLNNISFNVSNGC
jgi:hypothetical protein